jgi:hypothetical protein
MRIFLDANILFSAAKSAGAIQQLLHDLHALGHVFVADGYVVEEARRNVSAKADTSAGAYLQALLAQIDVGTVPYDRLAMDQPVLAWLPDKDRPVLAAAMALNCSILVTGDRTHFGSGYGKTFGGVAIHSPAQLAALLLP